MSQWTEINHAGAAAIREEPLQPREFLNGHLSAKADTDGMRHGRTCARKNRSSSREGLDRNLPHRIFGCFGDSDDARALGCFEVRCETDIRA